MKKMDVVALGELLIDFTPHGESEQGQPLYERNPGGAPANVLAALSKLGVRTAFIGSVGDDAFGRFLADTLRGSGINVEGLIVTEEAQTTLAFVHLDPGGDRSFTFCRKPGADQLLRTEQIDRGLVGGTRLFHFGSISMTNEPSRTATLEAAALAKESGAVVSYDPNLRLSLWRDAEHARAAILEGMALADVVKVSEEELLFLTGTDELDAGSMQLMEQYGMKLLLVTLGPDGSYCRTTSVDGAALTARNGGFKVDVVDTTGSGDAFFGGVLYRLLGEDDLSSPAWTEEKLLRMLAFANAMGALTATGKGAIPSLPTLEQAMTFAELEEK
ncbi:PfkB family carbohydrate kinase [Paenibacillus sp. LHD-117]|uniref:PfkB family carbohydrate kinase n=1 Tax=Paenibacillus sp. LHD-117 TaxID=3071412 RepID=UPI0027DEBA02|nr:PfkB family carbohydrate kinase [Paenibacillus sp. LHD-117]MDQ6420304.1 PfkB family carbohydrate kinase [Paenibacillus sp. LHD-117]